MKEMPLKEHERNALSVAQLVWKEDNVINSSKAVADFHPRRLNLFTNSFNNMRVVGYREERKRRIRAGVFCSTILKQRSKSVGPQKLRDRRIRNAKPILS